LLNQSNQVGNLDYLNLSSIQNDPIYLFHSSRATHLNLKAIQSAHGKRILFRHFTPALDYFAPYSRTVYRDLSKERLVLEESIQYFDLALADNEETSDDLRQIGFSKVLVAPYLQSPRDFGTVQSDTTFHRLLGEEKLTFITCAEFTPNQRVEDVIRLFGWYQRYVRSECRLLLLGEVVPEDYLVILKDLTQSLGLQNQVSFLTHLNLSETKACFEAADLFLSLSETGSPLREFMEATQFGIPVISSATRCAENFWGDSGIYVKQLDIPVLAEHVDLLLNDQAFRSTVVAHQLGRSRQFLLENSVDKLREQLAQNLVGIVAH